MYYLYQKNYINNSVKKRAIEQTPLSIIKYSLCVTNLSTHEILVVSRTKKQNDYFCKIKSICFIYLKQRNTI